MLFHKLFRQVFLSAIMSENGDSNSDCGCDYGCSCDCQGGCPGAYPWVFQYDSDEDYPDKVETVIPVPDPTDSMSNTDSPVPDPTDTRSNTDSPPLSSISFTCRTCNEAMSTDGVCGCHCEYCSAESDDPVLADNHDCPFDH